MSFLDDFLCLKKSRRHDFAGKFIEEHLDIRAIAENEEVKIEYIRDVCIFSISFFVNFNSLQQLTSKAKSFQWYLIKH